MWILHTNITLMSAGTPVNTSVVKIAGLPHYTEGPATDTDGNIYFTTLSGGTIMRCGVDGQITEWAQSGCPNGQIILPGKDHLVCDVTLAAVRRFGPDGRFIKDEVSGFCSGEQIHSPNDLVADADGNIYFTDSIRHQGKLCFVGTNGKQQIIADNLDYPNGVVLSACGDYLYLAESYKNRILKFRLNKNGVAASYPEILINLPTHLSGNETGNLPDGLAIDKAGNIWVAHYGMQAIHMISPEGILIYSIDTGLPLTSNLCFLDDHTLVVTGGYGEPGPGALLTIHLQF